MLINPKDLEPAQREAFHQAAEARIHTFKYETPENTGRPKNVVKLVKTEFTKLLVQVVRDGGENNLHYHLNSDTCWMVMKGGCRFYGPDDVLLAELKANEGIFMPGGARYWFEKTGAGDLEILQMDSIKEDMGTTETRINVDAHKSWMNDDPKLQVYETPKPA